MKALALAFLAAITLLSGCITQKQRMYLSDGDNTVYCTQRNTLFAMFGENATMHEMKGVCGTCEGDASNVGFNEEGVRALEGAVKAGVCAATGGVGCLDLSDGLPGVGD